MFSQTAEYALRASICLAQGAGGPMRAAEISAATKVPQDYLAKVLQALTRAGIVAARRGTNGGYALARPAGQVSILDVLNAVDPLKRITTCPLGLPAHGTKLCRLHRKLDDALATIERSFAEATLDQMTDASSGTSKPLCPTPG
ncbi:Rrf2 family transcriptional regulator [bacterium]|nr:Rrf2 family transcriptional regulator [bacterium]